MSVRPSHSESSRDVMLMAFMLVVQLWTMNNYHYYLKQELSIQHGDDRRFTGIFWHPEKPLIIHLIESRTNMKPHPTERCN